MKNFYMFMFSVLASASAFAGSFRCETQGSFTTPKGQLIEEICRSPDHTEESQSIWRLGDQRLVIGRYPVTFESANRSNTLFVLQGANKWEIRCPDQVFLIDLTGERPRVFSLGVNYSCAIFHWAKWSEKKRSAIALKDNVQFTYSNGKVIPPEDTDTKFGSPLGYSVDLPKGAQVTAFVRELPLPKN